MIKRIVLYIFVFIFSFSIGMFLCKDCEEDIILEKYITKNPSENKIAYENKAEMPEKGYVNINKATEYELTALTGIGQAMAERIVRFREENGEFEVKEDILKVAGIGDKTFDKIKDKITLN